MEAIILAGGAGTRLSPVISDRPKVLAEISGRPFLSYVLDWLYRCGVTHAVLAVSYMSDSVIKAFGNKYEGILLDYSKEETPLGTGGAIKKALQLCNESSVIVVNGDTVFDVDLEKMMSTHLYSDYRITIALKYMEDFSRYGTVETDGGKIVSFNEKKPCKEGYINGGVYIIEKSAFQSIAEERFSFEKDILENPEIQKGSFSSDGYFIDIGIPEDYSAAQRTLELSQKGRVRKALFLDRDGTLNIDKNHLYKISDFEFIDGMPELIKRYRNEGYLVIVITNQAGIAKGLYTEDDVIKLHKYINETLIKDYDTCIDAFFYCPHHPEGTVKKYAVSCGCRKPQPGLIHEAVFHFMQKGIRINIPESILMGNKDSDIKAGKAAGIVNCCLTDSKN